jgi:peptide/nickel transport system permease protein
MTKYLVRRAIFLILTLFVVSVIIFAVSELAPGNIAINTLGNTITPDQEASFNAQNGLDQPPYDRYVRWLIGSDWQAAQLIGHPVIRLLDAENNRYSWWIEAEDGSRYKNFTSDGETMMRLVLQPDGSTIEEPMNNDVWQPNADGILVYWGIDRDNRAAMWVKGENLQQWTLTHASWTNTAGAPHQYLPLQLGLLRGDPGVSFKDRRPVAEVLPRRLINTGILAGLAFVIVMPIALILGMIAGLNEGKAVDRILSIAGLVTTATPEFASAMFLILIFSTWLQLLPGAVVVTSENAILENPSMLVLPVLTLTLAELGYVLRITRASMVEVMKTNYIRTAVLKGLPRVRVVLKHALRNALMAPITIIILHVNWLVGGIVIVESVFGYPGLGRYVMEAALFKDVFAVEAASMLLVIVAVGTQLFADFVYVYINPRIRYA